MGRNFEPKDEVDHSRNNSDLDDRFRTLLNAVPTGTDILWGHKCPALIVDRSSETIAFFSIGTDGLNTPTNLALQASAQRLDLVDLSTSTSTLYLLGDLKGSFHGMGTINNFGISEVKILCHPRVQIFYRAGSPDYEKLILKQRGIKISRFSFDLVEKNSYKEKTHPSNSAFTPKVDEYSAQLEEQYRILNKKFGAIKFGDNHNLLEYQLLLNALHELALVNVGLNGGPFAAAVINPEGQLISVGSNRVLATCNPLMHAEISAYKRAMGLSGQKHLNGHTLVTTSQPCIGCRECSVILGLSKILYGNNSRTVEKNSIFTEGPASLKAPFEEQCLPSCVNLQAFDEFRKAGKPYQQRIN